MDFSWAKWNDFVHQISRIAATNVKADARPLQKLPVPSTNKPATVASKLTEAKTRVVTAENTSALQSAKEELASTQLRLKTVDEELIQTKNQLKQEVELRQRKEAEIAPLQKIVQLTNARVNELQQLQQSVLSQVSEVKNDHDMVTERASLLQQYQSRVNDDQHIKVQTIKNLQDSLRQATQGCEEARAEQRRLSKSFSELSVMNASTRKMLESAQAAEAKLRKEANDLREQIEVLTADKSRLLIQLARAVQLQSLSNAEAAKSESLIKVDLDDVQQQSTSPGHSNLVQVDKAHDENELCEQPPVDNHNTDNNFTNADACLPVPPNVNPVVAPANDDQDAVHTSCPAPVDLTEQEPNVALSCVPSPVLPTEPCVTLSASSPPTSTVDNPPCQSIVEPADPSTLPVIMNDKKVDESPSDCEAVAVSDHTSPTISTAIFAANTAIGDDEPKPIALVNTAESSPLSALFHHSSLVLQPFHLEPLPTLTALRAEAASGLLPNDTPRKRPQSESDTTDDVQTKYVKSEL